MVRTYGPAGTKERRYPGIYKVTRESAKGWRVAYVVSYRVKGVGQRTKTLPTLAEAKTYQGLMRTEAGQEKLRKIARAKANPVTVADWVPKWFERKRRLTESTRVRYQWLADKYIVPRLGQVQLTALTRDHVERWVAGLERDGVGAPTIDKAHRVLRACLSGAVDDDELGLESNVARRIELPESVDREPFFLTADQVDAVAQEVSPRHRALVYFLAYTGVRIGEASALRLRHLDFVRGVVRIAENAPEVGGRKLAPGKTKTKSVRSITLPAPLVAELAAHVEQFHSRDPEAFVFSGEKNSPIRQNNWRERVFQAACIRAGIVRQERDGKNHPPRVHDLRHTAASLAASAGYSLHEVKEMLGHSTITTTSNRYLHLFPDDRSAKADLLGKTMLDAQGERGKVVALRQS